MVEAKPQQVELGTWPAKAQVAEPEVAEVDARHEARRAHAA